MLGAAWAPPLRGPETGRQPRKQEEEGPFHCHYLLFIFMIYLCFGCFKKIIKSANERCLNNKTQKHFCEQ